MGLPTQNGAHLPGLFKPGKRFPTARCAGLITMAATKGKKPGKVKHPDVQAAQDAAREQRVASGTLGRPEYPYHPGYDDKAVTLSIAGFTHQKMADVFGVAINTFRKWMDENESFMNAVRFGAEQADAEIERSLFMSAKGYNLKKRITAVEKVFDDEGNDTGETRLRIHEWEEPQVPHPTSIIFYLSNRQNARYKRGDAGFQGGANAGGVEAVAKAAQAAILALDSTTDDPT